MATTVNRQVNIYIQSGEAEKAYDRLIAKEKTLKSELHKATDPAEVKRLTNELKKLEEPIERAGKKLKGELNPNIRDLKNTLSQLQKQLSVQGLGEKEFARLSVAVHKAKVELAEAHKRAAELGGPQGGLAKLGAGMRSFISGVGMGFGVQLFSQASTAVSEFFTGSIDEALEANRVVNNLKQTLAASGQEEYFDRIIEKANKMAETFRFLDNDDVTGVFTKLIDYGRLTENQINQLIPVIVDFYSKQQLAGNSNFSLAESASVVIKALEGNARALKEYGINVSEGKTETERLGIILEELAPKVKGAGDAFANDMAGQVAIATQEIKNQQEEIGNELIPVWEKLKLGALQSLQGIIQGMKAYRKAFVETFLMTDAEVKQRRKEEADAAAKQTVVDFVNSFVNSEAQKPIEQQRKTLENQIALLNAIRKEYTWLQATGSAYTQQGLKLYEQLQKDELIVKKLEESINSQESKTILGTGKSSSSPGSTGKSVADKEAEKLIKLIEDINRKMQELNLYNSSQMEKDLARMNDFYNGLEERAGTNKDLLIQIQDLRSREELLIVDKYWKQWEELEKKAVKSADQRKAERLAKERMAQLLSSTANIAEQVTGGSANALGNAQAAAELKVITSRGRAKIEAQKEQLDLEEQIALKAAEGMEEKKMLIEEQFRQRRAQLEIDHYTAVIGQITSIAQTLLDGLAGIFSQMSSRENQQLEEDRIRNEKKKENFKRQLDGKSISQREYDKKVQALEKQQEEREKQIKLRQFRRDKAVAIISATINTLNAVTKALAEGGPIYAAVVGALGLVQIGMIASQKPPKFAKGGYLPGPSHTEGGMPVINPRTGRKVAEVEGGEVILSRSTVRNNGQLVDQLLYSSLYRGGATINPAWRNASPSYLNIPMINSGIQTVRKFESGGVMPTAGSAGSVADNETMIALANSIGALNHQLAQGITAFTMISQNEIQQQRLNNIVKEATMK